MNRYFSLFLMLLLSFTCRIDVAHTQDKVGDEARDASTWMPDGNLRSAVRDSLGVANDAGLTQDAMKDLTELFAGNASISNIKGLEHATNLTKLDLRSNNISSITPLAGLTNLTDLWLAFNQITDISALGNLTSLTRLTIRDNQVGEIADIKNLTNLTILWVKNCGITDVSPLQGLTKLETLRIAENSLTNAHLLSSLTNLNSVDITIPDPPASDPPPDEDPPGVSISVPSGVQNGAFNITITFSETVSNFVQSDVSLSGSAASITAWSANTENTVYTATITPTASGTVSIGVAASVATDAANNQNTAATSQTVTVDVDKPTVTISVPTGTQSAAFNATVTFSETVSGFAQSDVSLTGSAASITTWSANSDNTVYTAAITPTASGTVTVGVAADVATDAAGNNNTAATSRNVAVSVDTIAPGVSISVPSGVQNSAFNATITFTEAVSGFAQSDVSLSGSASSITSWSANSDSTVYTATITPTASGTVTIGVAANVATDAANNQNTAATSQTVSVDVDAPSVRISVPSGDQTRAFDVSITFTEAVSGFEQSELLLSGTATASITAWSANTESSIYTATITPTTSGTVILDVAANVATDAANNPNTAATTQTVTIPDPATWMPDANLRAVVRGALGLTSNAVFSQDDMKTLTSLRAVQKQVTDLTGLEYATGLTKLVAWGNQISSVTPLQNLTSLTDLRLGGSQISDATPLEGLTSLTHLALQHNDISDVTPLSKLVNLTWLRLKGNPVTDFSPLSGLTGITDADVEIPEPDTDAPGVSITVPSVTQNGAFDATIIFTEAVSDFVQTDVSISGTATASITGWDTTDNTTFTATITPTTSGTVILDVAASVATDAANNANTAATTQTASVDIDAPGVSISVPSGDQTGEFDATITFTEVVSGFEQTDVSVSGTANASITAWNTTDNMTYTATITPSTSGKVTLSVPANVATDAASNANTASTTQTVTAFAVQLSQLQDPQFQVLDTDPPSVSIEVPEGVQNGAFDATITFTEAVSGFEQSDVSLTGTATASITVWSANTDDTVFTATITPTTSGTVILDIAASVATDAANNPNTAATTQTVSVDIDAPVVSLTLLPEVESNRIDLKITFTEPVEGFDSADLSITTSGLTQVDDTVLGVEDSLVGVQVFEHPITSITGWTPSPDRTTYTAYITTYSKTKGQVIFDVPAGVATDVASNSNVAGDTLTVDKGPAGGLVGYTGSDEFGWVDGTPNVNRNCYYLREPADYRNRLDINQDDSIDEEDVKMVRDALGQFGDGIVIPRTDINCDNTVDAVDLALVDDTQSPTVSISVPTDSQSGVFHVKITFSEYIFDFDQSDVSLEGSTATAAATIISSVYAGEGKVTTVQYYVRITPTSVGNVVISIPAGSVTDALGNLSTASDTQTVTVEELSTPTVTISAPREVEGAFDITIIFSEEVSGFDQSDVSLGGNEYANSAAASITAWNTTDNITYTATITPTRSGQIDLRIPTGFTIGADNTIIILYTDFMWGRIVVTLPDEVENAAPALFSKVMELLDASTVESLGRDVLEAQLQILLAESDGSLKYLQAIALLRNALAVLRPDKTQLLANYPNPFNPETWIPYHLANDTGVQISIYGINGARVRHLQLGHQRAGYYTDRSRAAYWDGRSSTGERVASGVYFYTLIADDFRSTRKMLIGK
ncbi:MAG: Ig-like domain-containing protein [Candidatus Poribacteria bacterium]|nr:Ig-like domain-containing protein [Candidatus Poribacteria bacterium]MDE0502970.1 Ig-like domain-containing protein [Candidatus Poribacteria bacterium]